MKCGSWWWLSSAHIPHGNQCYKGSNDQSRKFFSQGERHKISSNFEVLREWGLDVSEKDRKKCESGVMSTFKNFFYKEFHFHELPY